MFNGEKYDNVNEQASFCEELAKRIADDVRQAQKSLPRNIHRYSVISDVIRLRRELNELRKLLLNWWEWR